MSLMREGFCMRFALPCLLLVGLSARGDALPQGAVLRLGGAGPRQTAHLHGVTAVAFSPDGRSLLTGGPDTTIRLWNLRNGEERLPPRWDGQYWISSVACSPDGKTAAAGGHEETRVIDLASGKVLRELKGQAGVTQHLAFSADGKTLVTASSAGSLRWWDIATGQKR